MTSDLLKIMSENNRVAGHPRWPRHVVDDHHWHLAASRLGAGGWTLVALWGERQMVHMAVADETGRTGILTLECPDGTFPSVGRHHPPAQRLERAVHDLFGLRAEDAPDRRPWLDHGRWGDAPSSADEKKRYAFLPAEGEGLHQIAVGPVHAGIIEPGHFRFTVNGETVVRLEERLGYVHKGIEALMAGAALDKAVHLAGRTSGDSTVAYALAFSLAAEQATGTVPPDRAIWLRALMAELERLANHLGDIGAICNDAAFALMLAHCGVLRERVLRTCEAAFGHRMMRDCIVPGGMNADIEAEGRTAIRAAVDEIRKCFPPLVDLYDNTASLQDRTVGTGRLDPALAGLHGAGGYIGRASARDFDARRLWPYPPYDQLSFEVPVQEAGDVDARVRIRIAEVTQSLSLVEQILDRLPGGSLRSEVGRPVEGGEGCSVVEGFRGDVFVWMRLGADGTVERCHMRDPSWFQWPLLEAAIEGNIVADFPLCNKSFNCSYSGHDL